MLTIYCGDDSVASRQNFFLHKERLRSGAHELTDVDSESLPSVLSGIKSTLLFSESITFVGENLLSHKKNRDLLVKTPQSIDIVLWESKFEESVIKRLFTNAKIISSKLPDNLFTFLDSVKPGNKAVTLKSRARLANIVEENMLLFMLQKRIKQLFFVSSGSEQSLKLASWQISRLKSQARSWDKDKLLLFYDKLFTIESNDRTSSSYYSISQSLDILFCYYL